MSAECDRQSPMPRGVDPVELRFLGRVHYEEGLALQRSLAEHASSDYVLVLEHPEVITLGRSADRDHVLAGASAPVIATDRGGDVTWHGPGQVVVYPIVDLGDDPGAPKSHVCLLERVVAEVVADLLPDAPPGSIGRLEGHPGVWVGLDTAAPAKIAAVGIRSIRSSDGRRRSLHGIALNVAPDLEAFGQIVPCGLTRPVTSLRVLGCALDPDAVARRLGEGIADALAAGRTVRSQAVVAGRTDAETSTPIRLRRLAQAGVDTSTAVSISQRKPEWLRAPVTLGSGLRSTEQTVHGGGLVTVCEEAGCPNRSECWADGTATFMVNGADCTRACGFCQIGTAKPAPLDPTEPHRVAAAVAQLALDHAVVTCVARDDLADGGAGAIADTIRAIRAVRPMTTVEVLISDCKGDGGSLQRIFDERPDVCNHNLETVARLQRAVRPSAGYARSLGVLAAARAAGLVTKSGLMVGLGETDDEVHAAMADLRSVGTQILTIGQYLRPTTTHLPVARFWTPEEFDRLAAIGDDLGFDHVEASPLTRSSYHAKAGARAVGQPTTVAVSLVSKGSTPCA